MLVRGYDSSPVVRYSVGSILILTFCLDCTGIVMKETDLHQVGVDGMTMVVGPCPLPACCLFRLLVIGAQGGRGNKTTWSDKQTSLSRGSRDIFQMRFLLTGIFSTDARSRVPG